MLPDLIKLRASFAPHIGVSLVVLAGLLTGAGPLVRAQKSKVPSMAPVRLIQPIDELDLVPLEDHVRRDLTPDRDLGPVEDSMQLHLYMVLQRTPEQQADLDYLIARQQERTAPEYHRWLTSEQFGARFGAHPDDIATLSNWLRSHGVEVRSVLNNASMIDFVATAGQIREAFHTEMHYFNIAGGKYAANVADPQIPAALAPVVAGIHGMVKIPAPMNHTPIAQATYDNNARSLHRVNPATTGQATPDKVKADWDPGPSSTGRPVSPHDLYTIYDINPVFTEGDLGQTATVAVVEQSDIAYGAVNSTTHAATGGDVVTFRKLFGVPGTLNMHVYHGYGKTTCTDPGVTTSDEAQATIDAEWANATAPSANLVFMSCADSTDVGALSSLLAVVDNNLADVVSLSYTISELSATSSVYAFMDTLEAQAAVQGQSILVAAGNGGSDEKDLGTTTVATSGINVSAYSSPLVTVVGATDFQDFFDDEVFGGTHTLSNYWSTTNTEYYADALSYVPESAWNDSCASSLNALYEPYESEGKLYAPTRWCALHGTGDNGTVLGGGGGISTHYAVPAWQTGISGYSSDYRSSPDISSFGSDGRIYNRELLVCDSAIATAVCTSTSTFGAGGGTNWVAPYLAGVAGLLVTHSGSRQGLLNPTLYALAKAQYTSSPTSCYANGQAENDEQTAGLPAASCIFNDVTTGGNDVPCAAGSTGCVLFAPGEPYGLLSVNDTAPVIPNAYASAPGYDQATGIGSLNVTNLITNWDTAFKSATTLTAPSTAITSSENTTLKATVTGAGGTGYVDNPPVATGTVSFKAGTKALGSCTLSGGSCTLVVDGTSLVSGANSITATFAASPQYPSSTSSVLTITVTAGSTATPTFTPVAGTYTAKQSVTITDATSGATIYYTTNGTAPTTASTKYTGAISVAATETLEAIAVATGYANSAVASAKYTIETPAATPVFSVTAGTYTAKQSVTITDATSGAVIYYTTNGTAPTTASTKYTGAISVAATETLEAIAVATGYANSAVASAKYTIETPAATPVFSVTAGTYTAKQSVTIRDATSGAVIYYTTNGTTPTTASTKYTGAISVAATETVEALAVATGFTNSAVASAKYTIETPATTPVFSVAAGTYTAKQSVTITDATSGAVIYYTTNGTPPTTASTKYTGAISVAATETLEAIAVATDYTNSAVASAKYTIETPAATPVFSVAAGTYTAKQSVTIVDATSGAAIYYTTNGTTPTTASTKYTGAISVSATETIEAIAVAAGYTNSAVASAKYILDLTTATPTFKPAASQRGSE
jgi:subtilase family serine protease